MKHLFRYGFLSVFYFAFSQGALAEQLKLFRGLLHSHTHLSGGRCNPDEMFATARVVGLDFFAITEQKPDQIFGDDGVFITPSGYDALKAVAALRTVDDIFVAIHGQEVSTISKGNHVNVFNSDNIVDIASGDFRYLYERYLPEHTEGQLTKCNHPNYSKDQSSRTSRKKRNTAIKTHERYF